MIRKVKYGEWEPWFAWRPKIVWDREEGHYYYVWLEWLKRERRYRGGPYDYEFPDSHYANKV